MENTWLIFVVYLLKIHIDSTVDFTSSFLIAFSSSHSLELLFCTFECIYVIVCVMRDFTVREKNNNNNNTGDTHYRNEFDANPATCFRFFRVYFVVCISEIKLNPHTEFQFTIY